MIIIDIFLKRNNKYLWLFLDCYESVVQGSRIETTRAPEAMECSGILLGLNLDKAQAWEKVSKSYLERLPGVVDDKSHGFTFASGGNVEPVDKPR